MTWIQYTRQEDELSISENGDGRKEESSLSIMIFSRAYICGLHAKTDKRFRQSCREVIYRSSRVVFLVCTVIPLLQSPDVAYICQEPSIGVRSRFRRSVLVEVHTNGADSFST
ncbi:hypothetical protein DAEQUDRAFT_730058 [Daedalea quercina L-15889]|uniref:Uncharacterized protein n=1 Tax=Daedalea quercina L-15889 TaxID=1314783 RepID=A0A165N8A7_9APHY|nr:hypothetical protein DAEQUDRAFT_730058 [Daedalea quercina L-15889]